MKAKTILVTLAVLFIGAAVCFAADANMGTWKLNETKSKFGAGATKNTTVVYEAAGDMVKVTLDGVDSDGKPVHSEWTGKFDGKEYAAKGATNHALRAYTKVDANTLTYTLTKDGKNVGRGKVVVAADGKSRTVTETQPDADGKPVDGTYFFDKQ